MIDVSVIIVNYNTKNLTLQCLESLYKYTTGISIEVIVVDNNSQDGSVEEIKASFPQVILIHNSVNLGFGKGNNEGIRRAVGKYIFLLNSDCVLCNNVVKIFFDYAGKSSASVGAFGTLLLDENKIVGSSYGQFSTLPRILKNHFFEYVEKVFPAEKKHIPLQLPCEVEYIIGADLFIRKKVLDEIGLFDERFFMYSEENELQYRMYLKGYKRILIPGPEIIHINGGSTTVKLNRELMRYESLFKYVRKYNNIPKYTLFRIIMFCLLFPKTLFLPYTFKEKKKFISFLFK